MQPGMASTHASTRRTARAARRARAALAASTLVVAAACGAAAADAPASDAPLLAAGDSVVLADSGRLALGDLANAGLHVADDVVWVGDRQNGRVVRFARDGRALGVVGRAGGGPGELRAPAPLAPLAGGAVAVWDYGGSKVVAYEADGAVRSETPVREQALPLQLQPVGDTLWLGVVSLGGRTGAMRLALPGGAPERLAPMPAEYVEGLAYSAPYSLALRLGDTLLVGYAAHHRVFLHHAGGVDSLILPSRLRRGVPPDLLAQIKAGLERREPAKAVESYVSTLSRAARLPDGSVALVHYDVEFDHTTGAPADADAWLTVLAPDFRRACVDAPLPLAERSLPSLAFRGDTLFVLEQPITGDRTVPVLRPLAISTAGCAWLPVERG